MKLWGNVSKQNTYFVYSQHRRGVPTRCYAFVSDLTKNDGPAIFLPWLKLLPGPSLI